jgi:AbrB family looped-hinge helix DNA binding protein
MATLTVTERGQVTLRKEVLHHMGLNAGGKLDVELLPDGRVLLAAARQPGSIHEFFGLLASKTDKVASLEEIDEAIARGWAGQR